MPSELTRYMGPEICIYAKYNSIIWDVIQKYMVSEAKHIWVVSSWVVIQGRLVGACPGVPFLSQNI